jgi:hypothetical protein
MCLYRNSAVKARVPYNFVIIGKLHAFSCALRENLAYFAESYANFMPGADEQISSVSQAS